MAKSLVIVESPAKAKTIGKYLGKDFAVKASLGHIKDLPKKDLAVNVDKGFEPTYEVIEGKKKLIGELRSAAKGMDKAAISALLLGIVEDRTGYPLSAYLTHVVMHGVQACSDAAVLLRRAGHPTGTLGFLDFWDARLPTDTPEAEPPR